MKKSQYKAYANRQRDLHKAKKNNRGHSMIMTLANRAIDKI